MHHSMKTVGGVEASLISVLDGVRDWLHGNIIHQAGLQADIPSLPWILSQLIPGSCVENTRDARHVRMALGKTAFRLQLRDTTCLRKDRQTDRHTHSDSRLFALIAAVRVRRAALKPTFSV